ncbi:hypothetical protein B0H14DRAFT_2605072 [Mycena olivaceomarginata]|nr:hypothetical protein B0H14DRAFT_2605072 [Mycena olivaceomarginata]
MCKAEHQRLPCVGNENQERIEIRLTNHALHHQDIKEPRGFKRSSMFTLHLFNPSQSPPQSKQEGQMAYALPQFRRRKDDSEGESPVVLPIFSRQYNQIPVDDQDDTGERLDEREEYQGAPLALTYVSSGGPARWRVTSNARRANAKEGWFPTATYTVLQNYRETGEASIGSTLLSKR